ncbi:MAG TPA: T9SS type A sorting domain-containing protein [Cytophagaceae bacterium]
MKITTTGLLIIIFNISLFAQSEKTTIEKDLSSLSKIYPNPNNGDFTLELPFEDIFGEPAEFIIYDELGRKIAGGKVQVRGKEVFISTSLLPASQYYIRVWRKNEVITRIFSIDRL